MCFGEHAGYHVCACTGDLSLAVEEEGPWLLVLVLYENPTHVQDEVASNIPQLE